MSIPEECLPPYPPRFTHRYVEAWTVAGLTEKPALPKGALLSGETVSGSDIVVRRLVERTVADRQHLEQLKAWARAKASRKDQDLSFARACAGRGWSESTAKRNVERALAAILIAMNLAPDL